MIVTSNRLGLMGGTDRSHQRRALGGRSPGGNARYADMIDDLLSTVHKGTDITARPRYITTFSNDPCWLWT